MTATEAKKLIDQGYVAVVVVNYGYADKQAGEIVSKHKSYEAANRKANGSSMWAVSYISNLVTR